MTENQPTMGRLSESGPAALPTVSASAEPIAPNPAGPRTMLPPRADVVRDVIAAVVLGLSLMAPWAAGRPTTGRVDAVLGTVAALAALLLPYAARAGVLPAGWTVHRTRVARVVLVAPLLVLALVYLGVDAFTSELHAEGPGGIGAGWALALAGALLAGQARESELGPVDQEVTAGRRWRRGLVALAVVVILCALVTLVLGLTDGPDGAAAKAAVVLTQLFWIGSITFLVIGVESRYEAARICLVWLGVATAVAFAARLPLGHGLGLESMHVGYFGLVALPAAAAIAASPALAGTMAPVSTVPLWTSVARRGHAMIAVVGGFVAIYHMIMLADGHGAAAWWLGAFGGLACAVLGALGRSAVARNDGRPRAALLAAAAGLIGLAVAIACTRLPAGLGVVYPLLALALPSLVCYGIVGPREVREFNDVVLGADDPAEAYVWRPAPARARRPAAEAGDGTAAASGLRLGLREPSAQRGPGAHAESPDDTTATRLARLAAGGAAAGGAGSVGAGSNGVGSVDVGLGGAAPGAAVPIDGGPIGSPPVGLGPMGSTSVLGGPLLGGSLQGGPLQGGALHGGALQGGAMQAGAMQADPALSSDGPFVAGPPAAMVEDAPAYDEGLGAAPIVVPGRSETAGYGAPAVEPGPFVVPEPTQRLPLYTAAQAIDPATPLATLAEIVEVAPHLRAQVAANPSTYPALLDWLANLGDPDVDLALRMRRG